MLQPDLAHTEVLDRFALTSLHEVRRVTKDWHRRYNAVVAVSGHLHVRRTDLRDGTRFEEVSLGYPKQWDPEKGVAAYLREIMPAG